MYTAMQDLPTPLTILTGFLGSGKTTLLLNLVPQLPKSYKLALLKNEFGDLAVDSQLAAAQSISGVEELLNGCICCNLVGQLGDALKQLRETYGPDRIVIETSGSAFPATLAMEVNRLARESADSTGHPLWTLDGVISVIDVENWKGYDDTSVTAKMQAQYTDLIVFNKWESVSERRFDECLDRLGDLEVSTAWVKSNRGAVGKDIILGLDGGLARELGISQEISNCGEHSCKSSHGECNHIHDNRPSHQEEVEVLSATLKAPERKDAKLGVDLEKLQDFLLSAPKDEIYRIKAILYSNSTPTSSTGEEVTASVDAQRDAPVRYILNWAFGRWTFTAAKSSRGNGPDGSTTTAILEPLLRMTVVSARGESRKWKKRLEEGALLALDGLDDEHNKGLLSVIEVA